MYLKLKLGEYGFIVIINNKYNDNDMNNNDIQIIFEFNEINNLELTLTCDGYDDSCENPLFSIQKAKIIKYNKNNIAIKRTSEYDDRSNDKIIEYIDKNIENGNFIIENIDKIK